MAKSSVVMFSYVEKNEIRMDGDYYKPEFLEIEKCLNLIEKKYYLSDISRDIFHPKEFKREYSKASKGIPLIRISNVSKGIFLEKKDFEYIYKKDEIFLNKNKVVEGDIIITRSGTIGLPVIITKSEEGYLVSADFIVLKIDKNKINPYYLLIYLASKFGRQIIRGSIGGVQHHINTQNLRKIIVIPGSTNFQLRIEQLIKQAYEKRKLAEQKYQQAEELLYKLLGITKEEIEKLEEEKGYETNFKNVVEAFRFDAEYYHPKYLGIIELLEKSSFEVKLLRELVDISDEKVDPTSEENKTKRFRYVPIAKINESGEIFEWDEFYGWQAPSRARMLIRENDIIIPSLAGTFDKIALVPKELDKQLATTGCFVIRSKGDYPEFLFLLFRTPLFKRQLEQQTTGAIMSAVPKSVFGNLLIPKIPKNKQINIAKLVREYFELRKGARELIKQAVREVEEEIENVSKSNRK